MLFVIEQFDVFEYDFVILSSYVVVKGVLIGLDQVYISYVYLLICYVWDLQYQYLEQLNFMYGLKLLFVWMILYYICNWDMCIVNVVDGFVVNFVFIVWCIRKVYYCDVVVIFLLVDVDVFLLNVVKEEFYLIVLWMVLYKKIDLIVEVFLCMFECKLVVIGDGFEMQKICVKVGLNVEIMGYQLFVVLYDWMWCVKVFVFVVEEDFGILVVEVQVCGMLVIVYGKGGVFEIVFDL